MRVDQLGTGTPELAVVGGIHGDEPCGPRAIDRLLSEEPAVERPVKLIVANEAALRAGRRFVDEDLNRAFPGDPEADAHEPRLAARLVAELEGCATLSLHSTRSYADPFALVSELDESALAICSRLPVDAVVHTGRFTDGRLLSQPRTIEAECGQQGSGTAADNAYRVIRAFLAATGALDPPADESAGPAGRPPVFRLRKPLSKPSADRYEVYAANFAEVAAGDAFAGADDVELLADEPFYPVLLSAHGYEGVFGYAAERVGDLERDGDGRLRTTGDPGSESGPESEPGSESSSGVASGSGTGSGPRTRSEPGTGTEPGAESESESRSESGSESGSGSGSGSG